MAYTPQQIAAAIRQVESGGNYTAHSKTTSASGAYQYVDGTWNHYMGYAHAWQAPASVQDAKALADVTNKLKAYGGDASKTIMSWFLPAAVNNPKLAATVPKGNAISPNQYVAKVMGARPANASPAGSDQQEILVEIARPTRCAAKRRHVAVGLVLSERSQANDFAKANGRRCFRPVALGDPVQPGGGDQGGRAAGQ